MPEAKNLSIYDFDFPVSQPYEAGHTLTEAEARALNQVRKENLGNNFRGTVKKALDAAAAEGGTPVDPDALQAAFADLDSKYEFTLATVAASRKLDPVEREVRNLIKSAVREQLAGETPPRKLSDLADDELENIIEANSTNADILKLAKKMVADKQKVAGFTLSGLGGSAGEGAPAEEATTSSE